jgi:hypothetical protein
MSVAEAWNIIEPSRVALQRILDGAPPLSNDDVGQVGAAFNGAWLRLRRIPGRKPDLELLERAVRVLERLCVNEEIARPDGDQAHELKTAINLFDRTVRVCTSVQWFVVEQELLVNARRGELV